jgi:hypothetical protein
MANGLELSFDNGATFKLLKDTGTDDIRCVDFGPNVKKIVRVVYFFDHAYSKIRCSLDGGKTLYGNGIASTTGEDAFATGQSEPNVLYYADWTTYQLFRSDDYGETVTELFINGNNAPNVTCIFVDPTDADHVMVVFEEGGSIDRRLAVSDDGGTTWDVYTKSGLSIGAWSWRNFASGLITRAGSELCFPAYEITFEWISRIYRKAVSGGSLIADTIIDENDLSQGIYHSVIPSGANGSRVLLGGTNPSAQGGLWLSKDGGATYSDIYSATLPAPGYSDGATRVALSMSGLTLYVSIESHGLYKSTDDGASWSEVFQYDNTTNYRTNAAVVCDPIEENWVWLNAFKRGVSQGYGIYLSKDAGVTWRKRRTILLSPHMSHNPFFQVAYKAAMSA